MREGPGQQHSWPAQAWTSPPGPWNTNNTIVQCEHEVSTRCERDHKQSECSHSVLAPARQPQHISNSRGSACAKGRAGASKCSKVDQPASWPGTR
eukprot:1153327-Pelagomonas_calceolata.AAC.2